MTNTVPYCDAYVADTSSCTGCVDGYRLDRDTNTNAVKDPNVCKTIDSTLNCIKWNDKNNVCFACKVGYVLESWIDTAVNYSMCVPVF